MLKLFIKDSLSVTGSVSNHFMNKNETYSVVDLNIFEALEDPSYSP